MWSNTAVLIYRNLVVCYITNTQVQWAQTKKRHGNSSINNTQWCLAVCHISVLNLNQSIQQSTQFTRKKQTQHESRCVVNSALPILQRVCKCQQLSPTPKKSNIERKIITHFLFRFSRSCPSSAVFVADMVVSPVDTQKGHKSPHHHALCNAHAVHCTQYWVYYTILSSHNAIRECSSGMLYLFHWPWSPGSDLQTCCMRDSHPLQSSSILGSVTPPSRSSDSVSIHHREKILENPEQGVPMMHCTKCKHVHEITRHCRLP